MCMYTFVPAQLQLLEVLEQQYWNQSNSRFLKKVHSIKGPRIYRIMMTFEAIETLWHICLIKQGHYILIQFTKTSCSFIYKNIWGQGKKLHEELCLREKVTCKALISRITIACEGS